MPDGTTQKVLVPQVYVRLRPGDIDGSGALLSGKTVNLNLTGDLRNASGTVAGRDTLKITAENINNLGGRLTGAAVALTARNVLNVIGASVTADNSLIAQAGHDINVVSTTHSASSTAGASSFERTTIDRVAGLYVTGQANGNATNATATIGSGSGVLVASAGHDLNLVAGIVVNAATAGTTTLAAGNDLNLATVRTSQSDRLVFDAKNRNALTTSQEVGSQIQGAGSVRLQAGRDLVATAADIQATGALALVAGRDVLIGDGQNTVALDAASEHTSKSFIASHTLSTKDKIDQSNSVGSNLGGATVTAQAGHDIAVTGSNIASDTATTLLAGNNLTVQAGTSTSTETHYSQEQNSGLMSSGGIGFTYGERKKSDNDHVTSTTAAASTVGSGGGNVTLVAGNAYRQMGSDVLAPVGDVTIAGKSVAIVEARETSHSTSEQLFSQSGLTVAVTAPVVQAVQAVAAAAKATGETKNARMQALGAAAAALAAKAAAAAVQEAVDKAATGSVVNVSITVGQSKSKTDTTSQSDSARGSSVSGNNVVIAATGAGQDSNLLIQGSDVTAKTNATLLADNRIDLLASQSSAVGVAIDIGARGMAFGVTASASGARGHQDGADVGYTNTHIKAGNTANLISGGDTTLKGAVVAANSVNALVGGNLLVQSLQDTTVFDSKNQSIGGSATVGLGGSGSGYASNAKAKGDFASVAEQSGLKAGDGGFNVNVKGNTNLAAGVISSTQAAIDGGLNSFKTASLTTSDIENRSAAKASSATVNVSSDMLDQGKYGVAKAIVGGVLSNGSASSSASGATRSAVSGGQVVITDEAAQLAVTGKTAAETVAALNRDTTGSNVTVQKQDVKALQEQAQAAQVIKGSAVKQLTVYTDDAYATMFQTDAKFYRVTCGGTQEQCMKDPSLVKMEEIDSATAKREGKVLAANGILNDQDRAGQLAYQNASLDDDKNKPSNITLMHIAPAATTLGELLVATYEQKLASTLGYTNADNSYADALEGRGQEETISMGHSRGTIVQTNAFNILGDKGFKNENLKLEGVGMAVSLPTYIDAGTRVMGADAALQNITATYMTNDPVSVIAADNPGDAWAAFKEFYNVVAKSNSAHSCYGTGATGCVTIASPIPNGPQPTNQQPGNVITYQGGQLVQSSGSK